MELRFGSEAQQALLHRGQLMHQVTGDDPRFTYYGRTVGLAGPSDGPVSTLSALARLQGNSNYGRVPVARMQSLAAEAQAEGLSTVTYARWEGGDDAIAAADAVLERHALPSDLAVHRLGENTSPAIWRSFADMALGCGVLPPTGSALTGRMKPGVTLVAVTGDGRAVSCAAAVVALNPGHPDAGRESWWGMLATDSAWRGRRLSLILGAQVLATMARDHGFTRFFTGVEPGNAASEAVCARMGLERSPFDILGAADPSLVPGGRMTK